MSALEGHPRQPWTERFNLTVRPLCAGADWVSLATAAALWIRVRPMPLTSHLFLASASAGCLANAAWRSASSAAAPVTFAWLRRRELAASLFRLLGFGAGAGMMLIEAYLNDLAPAEGTGWQATARHVSIMALASLVPSLLLLWLARPVRIGWAVPVQLALTLHCSTYNARTCATRAVGLGTPSGRHLMSRTYQLLSVARHITSPPVPHAPILPPEDQCAVLLTFAQLTIALALPALAQAWLESRLFQLHQTQRQRAGLPAETGVQATLYAALSSLREALDGPLLVLALWVSLGLLFDLALLVALGGSKSGGQAQ